MKSSAILFLGALMAGSALLQGQTVEDFNLPQHSTFDGSLLQRDPFLPIGWKPPEAAAIPLSNSPAAPPTIESVLQPTAFVVSSISLDRIPLAIINGKAYGEGDSIPFTALGQKIQLQVFAIRDGEVILRYNELKITCPIRLWQKPAVPKK